MRGLGDPVLLDDGEQVVQVERLREKPGRAELRSQALGVVAPRYHDNRRVETTERQLTDEAPAIEHGHPHVEEHE